MRVQKAYRLCGNIGALCESHRFPKFYWDWMKETNGTGYLRSSTMPNVSLQDGDKRRLLCLACEARFSVLETHVAGKVFRPLLEDPCPAEIDYGPWFYRFAISVLWRKLAINIDAGPRLSTRGLSEWSSHGGPFYWNRLYSTTLTIRTSLSQPFPLLGLPPLASIFSARPTTPLQCKMASHVGCMQSLRIYCFGSN